MRSMMIIVLNILYHAVVYDSLRYFMISVSMNKQYAVPQTCRIEQAL